MSTTTNKFRINYRKIPYYLTMTLLTGGASLILGFLSFGGMYALLPVLPLAFAAFAFTAAYDGEIYLQNVKNAFKKLVDKNYLKNHLAKEYLHTHIPDLEEEHCPQFFKDYAQQRHLLELFTKNHRKLTKESQKKKKHIEKTLTEMEQWFARHLFAAQGAVDEKQSAYTQSLREWLGQVENEQGEWQALAQKRQATFQYIKAFSLLAAGFMSLGSTYLIVEVFTVIPLMAALSFGLWPALIIPMALIAGAAWGMLTYNAMTDLVTNDTVTKWYRKIRDDLSKGLSPRNVFVATVAVLLVGIAIALTICTAGTWWTVAHHARPLFAWMTKIPSFVLGIINPIITGISTIFFNVENIAESMELVNEAPDRLRQAYTSIVEGIAHVVATENWLQRLNPFRLILKLTITPLRILLFFGHLISLSLTADRMPGMPKIIAILIAIISEGFEDAHYFFGEKHGHHHGISEHEHDHDHDHDHDHEHHAEHDEDHHHESGHNHNTDIPTRLLNFIALPLYALAAAWDCITSKRNPITHDESNPQPRVLTLAEAWKKQRGIEEEEEISLPITHPSKGWQVEHTVFLIEKHQENQLNKAWKNSDLARKKIDGLNQLKQDVRAGLVSDDSIEKILVTAQDKPVYNQHRLFSIHNKEKTCTQKFIEALPERVNAI